MTSYLSVGDTVPVFPATQPKSKGFHLLSTGTDAKTVKGEKRNYLTFILYLAPADESGIEMCHWRSAGCTSGCLYTAGNAGVFKSINEARIRKTQWFNTDRASFMDALVADILVAERKASRKGMIPVFRLNGTSDVLWERIPVGKYANIFAMCPDLQFYDYSKAHHHSHNSNREPNYHVTFSRAEDNERIANRALANGLNVAMVFRTHDTIPSTYNGYRVVDGDADDLRFLDPKNCIVGLKAKGKARKDTSGFVIDIT